MNMQSGKKGLHPFIQMSKVVDLPHWHDYNPWRDDVIYVPPELLVDCHTGLNKYLETANGTITMTKAVILDSWAVIAADNGGHMDAYVLPEIEGRLMTCGIRYGKLNHEYLTPAVNMAMVKSRMPMLFQTGNKPPLSQKYYLHRCTWTEYEKGWGERPDGYSYALDKSSLEVFIKKYESRGGEYEHIYSDVRIVEVTAELYTLVAKSEHKHLITPRSKHEGDLS